MQQHLAFQTIQFTMLRVTPGFVLLPGANIGSFFFANNGLGYVLVFFSPRTVWIDISSSSKDVILCR